MTRIGVLALLVWGLWGGLAWGARCHPATYTEVTILPNGRQVVCVVTVQADCSVTRVCL
jgi:hypothetical protein